MEQKRQKPPPPSTAARDSGLELSNSNGKKGVPAWSKWLIGGASVFGVLGITVAGLAIAKGNRIEDKNREQSEKIDELEYENREFEKENYDLKFENQDLSRSNLALRERKKGKKVDVDIDIDVEAKSKKFMENMRLVKNIISNRASEPIKKKEEKSADGIQRLLEEVKIFKDNNLNRIIGFLSKSRDDLKSYIVSGRRNNKTFDVTEGTAKLGCYPEIVLRNFKEKIDCFNEVSIAFAKKNVVDHIEQKEHFSKKRNKNIIKNEKVYKEIDNKNCFYVNFKTRNCTSRYVIEILGNAKFELRSHGDGLGVTFESHDLQLQKVEDEAAPVPV